MVLYIHLHYQTVKSNVQVLKSGGLKLYTVKEDGRLTVCARVAEKVSNEHTETMSTPTTQKHVT